MPAKNEIEPNDWIHVEGAETRDPLRAVLRQVVEALMSAEADAVCGAQWGERRRGRLNSRNGYRTRTWDTQVGTIDLAIPKLRHGTYFPEWLLGPERRAERTLMSTLLEIHAKGVTPRRMATLLQSLGIGRLSRHQIWKVTRDIETAVRNLHIVHPSTVQAGIPPQQRTDNAGAAAGSEQGPEPEEPERIGGEGTNEETWTGDPRTLERG
jgi:transposase-like protein